MFCPRCGKADHIEESYCRQCGVFLPDFDKLAKREISPDELLKANTALSLLTICASFTLSFRLFAILGFMSTTHPLIYATAGLLIVIGGWHIQSFIRTQKLKTQWKRRTPLDRKRKAFPHVQVRFDRKVVGRIRLFRSPDEALFRLDQEPVTS